MPALRAAGEILQLDPRFAQQCDAIEDVSRQVKGKAFISRDKAVTYDLIAHGSKVLAGIFVETRLRELLKSGEVDARVVAPVPWFPFRHEGFGVYAQHASAPSQEQRHGIEVLHPRYLAIPKLGMTPAPLTLNGKKLLCACTIRLPTCRFACWIGMRRTPPLT